MESSKRAWQRMTESYFLQKWKKTDNAIPDLKRYGISAPSSPEPKLDDKSAVALQLKDKALSLWKKAQHLKMRVLENDSTCLFYRT